MTDVTFEIHKGYVKGFENDELECHANSDVGEVKQSRNVWYGKATRPRNYPLHTLYYDPEGRQYRTQKAAQERLRQLKAAETSQNGKMSAAVLVNQAQNPRLVRAGGKYVKFVYEPNDGPLHRSLQSAFDRFRELGISVNENEANRLHRIATKKQKGS